MRRNEKGITLIALVVTIVVLLILAGVSISLILGNNGIISKAKDAKNQYAEAAENEQAELNDLDSWIDEQVGNGGTGEKTLYQAVIDGDIKIGDYVKYTPNASGTYTSVTNENGWADQTYNVDSSTQWRILGTQGNQVILISADPIKKEMNLGSANDGDKDPYLYMKGAYSYVNCEKMLNDICGIYSNNLGTARSLTIEDINKVLGIKVENDKVYFETDPETNIIEYGPLGATYTYKDTNYTPEGYIDGKKTVSQQNPKPEKATQDAYAYKYENLMSKPIGNTTIGNLLFDETESDSNYAKAYWLASPATRVRPDYAFFGSGNVYNGYVATVSDMVYVEGNWNARRLAVRPIVVLNSNVTVTQVPTTKGSTQTWGYDNNKNVVEIGGASNGEAGIKPEGRTTIKPNKSPKKTS